MSAELKEYILLNEIDIGVENNIIYAYNEAPNRSDYFNIPNDPFFEPSVSNGGSRKKKITRNIKRKNNIKSKHKIK